MSRSAHNGTVERPGGLIVDGECDGDDVASGGWDKGCTDAFSDGVFAIAITILVLEIKVPSDLGHLGRDLEHEWPAYLAYVTSFLTIGGVWIAHHRLFSRLRVIDATMVERGSSLRTDGLIDRYGVGGRRSSPNATQRASTATKRADDRRDDQERTVARLGHRLRQHRASYRCDLHPDPRGWTNPRATAVRCAVDKFDRARPPGLRSVRRARRIRALAMSQYVVISVDRLG
jgi:hypothetical protein